MSHECFFCGEPISFAGSEIASVTRCESCGKAYYEAVTTSLDRRQDSTTPPTLSLTTNAIPTGSAELSATSRLGDYEILNEISRGGMGVVYLARQLTLNRVVALKTILPSANSRSEMSLRFQKEAEAAAKLDHPGIVPIFEVGEANGLLYYSMAYIEGESLNNRAKTKSYSNREAASTLEEICDAIGYAHQQGVLHRDLKPHNILLDDQDRPRVADFGLAKTIETDSELTATGEILGTPSYMPPEQARGEMATLDETADVYSLGGVLYYLITGNAPFQAPNTPETIRQVIENDPVPPRQINAKVDFDLETICLKCLRKEPSKRYQSAYELKEDLRCYLRNEPISARRFTYWERTQRWVKRNPRVAALSLTVLGSLLIGTIVSTAFALEASHQAKLKDVEATNATNRETEAVNARLEAERKSLIAKEQSELALAAVTEVIFRIQTELRRIPEARDARVRMLQKAKDVLIQVSENLDSEAIASYALCQIHIDLGGIFSEIAQTGDIESDANAQRQFELATEVAREWHLANPKDQQGIYNLCLALTKNSEQLYRMGNVDDAEPLCLEALSNADTINAETDYSIRITALEMSHSLLGRILENKGRPEEAEEHIRAALTLIEGAAIEFDATTHLEQKAFQLGNLFDVQLAQGKLQEAMESAKERLEAYTMIEENSPSDVRNTINLAQAHYSIAMLLDEMGNIGEAIDGYRTAENTYRTALERDPFNWVARADLAATLSMLGALYLKERRPSIALPELQESLQIRQAIATEISASWETDQDIASSQIRLASCFLVLGDRQRADGMMNQSIELMRGICEANPSNLEYRNQFAGMLDEHAQYRLNYGAFQTGLALARQSLVIRKELLQAAEDHVDNRLACGITYSIIGNAELELGDYQAAVDAFQSALDFLKTENSPLSGRFASLDTEVALHLGQAQIAVALFKDEQAFESEQVKKEPTLLIVKAQAQIEQGSRADALQTAKVMAEQDEGDGQLLFLAARIAGRCIARDEDQSDGLDSEFHQQGRLWLQLANQAGFFEENPEHQLWLSLCGDFEQLLDESQIALLSNREFDRAALRDQLIKEAKEARIEAYDAKNAGKIEKAVEHFVVARNRVEEAVLLDPENPEVLELLAYICYQQGDLVKSSSQSQSKLAYERGIGVWRELLERAPSTLYRSQLGGILHNHAGMIEREGDLESALTQFQEAYQLQKQAFEAEPMNDQHWQFLKFHCEACARLSLRLGKHADAARYANEAGTLGPESAYTHLDIAISLINCIEQARSDSEIDEEERISAVAKYTEQLIARLERCQKLGFDLKLIQDDPRIQPVMNIEAVRELVSGQNNEDDD